MASDDWHNSQLKDAVAQFQNLQADTHSLTFGFCSLFCCNHRQKVSGKPPQAKTVPSLEAFKGARWPEGPFASSGSLMRAAWRFYWSKKGRIWGLVLFALKGMLPVIATIFFGQMMHEVTHPERRDEASLVVWGASMYVCHLLHSVVVWQIVVFKRTWGIAGPTAALLDAQLRAMKGKDATTWSPAKGALVMQALMDPQVGTFLGASLYSCWMHLCTFVGVLGVTVWHMSDHPMTLVLAFAITLVMVLASIAVVLLFRKPAAALLTEEGKAKTALFEFFQLRLLKARAEVGSNGACDPTVLEAFAATAARGNQHTSQMGVALVVTANIQVFVIVTITTLGGLAILDSKLKLPDLAALVIGLHLAVSMAVDLANELGEVSHARPFLEKIIQILDFKARPEAWQSAQPIC